MLIVIPFNDAQRHRAERLCDLIYWQSGQRKIGDVLFVSANVHREFQIKVRIAAELAFENVDGFELLAVSGSTPVERWNNTFIQAARYIRDAYRVPWLWLEPNCVPLKRSWMDDLMLAYDQQPKRYLGPHMIAGEDKFLHRVSVYPPDAARDFEEACLNTAPFERVAQQWIIPRSTKTKLIQIGRYDPAKPMQSEAVLFAEDATGQLVEKIIGEQPVYAPTEFNVVKSKERNLPLVIA